MGQPTDLVELDRTQVRYVAAAIDRVFGALEPSTAVALSLGLPHHAVQNIRRRPSAIRYRAAYLAKIAGALSGHVGHRIPTEGMLAGRFEGARASTTFALKIRHIVRR